VDDADPGPLGVARAVKRPRRAGELDRALVGRVHTGHDLHEGGLAGAVLTDDGVHFTRQDIEVHPFEDAHAEERLADAPEREQRRRQSVRHQGPLRCVVSRIEPSMVESFAYGVEQQAPARSFRRIATNLHRTRSGIALTRA
jgi:hypothetical protein